MYVVKFSSGEYFKKQDCPHTKKLENAKFFKRLADATEWVLFFEEHIREGRRPYIAGTLTLVHDPNPNWWLGPHIVKIKMEEDSVVVPPR